MPTASNPLRLVSAFLASFLISLAKADVIAIADGSFDIRALNAGSWSNNIDPWSETAGPNNGNGFVERINGFASDGNNHLGMNLGHDVWQDLGVTYQANTRYTLTVAVGNRVGNTNAGNDSQFHLASPSGTLFASGSFNASTLTGGTFADAPALVFDTPNQVAAVGQTIRILLRARGNGRSHFDRIRLTSEPLLPNGTAVLGNPAIDNLTATGGELQVEVLDPGVQAPQLTFFWGDNNGGTTASAWDFQETLPGTHAGVASLAISGLNPGQEYLLTVRATNSAGVSWLLPAGSFATPPLAPSVQGTAATQITPTTAMLGGTVLSTGGEVPEVTVFYGPEDGGTNPGLWASAISTGAQSGSFPAPASGLLPETTYYFRLRAVNSAGESWSDTSLSFTTLAVLPPVIANLPPTGITGTTATLAGEVVSTGNEAPQITIFYGSTDGGTNASAWEQSISLGTKTSQFEAFVSSLTPTTPYFFRARGENSAASVWAPETLTFSTSALLPSSVIFHEIHFKPEDESTLGEFIELHNPGDTAVDLSGWRISSGVSYDFPTGTVMPAGGYLVVAQDPAQILATYGVNALGPYAGALSSSGERLNLRNESDQVVDRVDYGVGFPWPCRTDGGGSSIELIHPSLDGELPGSWRASGNALASGVPETYLATQSTGWKFRRGTTEATSPISLWRDSNFNDASWENGQMPLGYGTTGLNTTITGMRNNYRTIYLRKTFTVPSGAVPDTLKVRLYLDDGCVIWINGQEVHRRNVPSGNLTYLSLASAGVSPAWHEFTIPNADEILDGGTNVIAVHLLNATLGSSDLAFDIELSEPDGTLSSVPTPGAANSVREGVTHIPPQIDQVSHLPMTPRSGEAVTVSARIIDPDGVAGANLLYQLVDPGSYIRLTDAAYATTWTTVPMTPTGGGQWSAILPGSLQVNRRLVRYRIDFVDQLGNSQLVPYADDESPNFAYFVYDGIPAWQGAFRPGQTALTTFNPATLESLPVYTLVAADQDVINSQYNSGFDTVRMYGSFVHNGLVHDHIQFRNRGEGSTYQAGKNKWRFYFNRGSRFQATDADGRPYLASWTQFSGNPASSPWAPLNRGAAGLDEMVPFRAFQLAGVPSPNVHHYHFRLIRGAQESPAATSIINNSLGNSYGQYLGDFWGLYLAVEPIAGSFLDERGLPAGNIYKIENNNGDKKEQAAGQPVDSSDWIAFRDAHVNADPSESWWRQNMDLESYFSFHAINRLTGNIDLRGGSNHYFYRRSSDNRWVPIPWDLDMMFIPKHHWGSPFGSSVPDVIHAHKAILQHPQIALEYRNRAREILDLLASDAAADGGQIGQLIAEISGRVHATGSTNSFAWADACQWNLHPRTNGTDGVASGQGNHRGNFYRSPFSDSRDGGSWVRWLRNPSFTGTGTPEDTFSYFLNYATNTWPGGTWVQNNGDQRGYGYQFVLSEIQDANIPAKPVLTYSGASGFPLNKLQVTASGFVDPQGAGTFAARQWRIARIGAPGAYELEPLWTTVTSSSSVAVMNLPSAGLMVGETYRARVRQQDGTGRWSHWSDPVEFTAAAPVTQLVHYWNFNNATAPLPVTQSSGGANLAVAGSFLSGNAQGFAASNARFGDIADDHLRINNPLTPGTQLNFTLPTTGFSKVVVKYETRRSGQGAGEQIVEYTLNGSDYLPHSIVVVQDADPAVVELDFRSILAANDNPLFGLRIRFNQATGGTAGNHRFDNLTMEAESIAGGPRMIAGTDALWNFAENWHHAEIPNATGAPAILGVPTQGNRAVSLVAGVTVGSLTIETGSSAWRNRLQGVHPLSFDAVSGMPEIRVTGASTGFAELEVTGGVVLTEDLLLDVQNPVGDPEHGALRLREAWSGPGGITKTGPGMASLTGIGKNFTGPVRIEEGVLKITGSSSPASTSEIRVMAGGQLRLSSVGSIGTPALHATGGTMKLAGAGGGNGGALRYDPGIDAASWAAFSADLLLESAAELHVAGASNGLVSTGAWSGEGLLLTKSGEGRLVISGTSGPVAPAVAVTGGRVDVNGVQPGAFLLSAGSTLGGTGTVGAIQGPGVVDAGETEISATSLSGGMIQARVTTSSSGRLRLSAASPILNAPSVIELFLDSAASWATGDRRSGGLLVPHGVDLSTALTSTTVSIYLPDPAGSVSYAGQSYRLANATDGLEWSVASVSAGVTLEVLKTGVPSGYAQWRNLVFDDESERANELVAGPEASAAGDGIANIVRYAHGVGPLDPVADLLPRMVSGLASPEFQFRFDPGMAGVAWVVRSSADLSDWNDIEFDSRTDPPPASAGGGWSRLVADPGDTLRFYRLEILED